MLSGIAYRMLYTIVRIFMFFYHPVFHISGRENIPDDGAYLICPNHAGLADPIWVVFGLGLDHLPRIMAKKELMGIPVLGWILKKIGVFGVDRKNMDIQAVKQGIRCLRDRQQLIIFPEGTRVKNGKDVRPKNGAVHLSYRTDAPILPVYISVKRRPFGSIACHIGPIYRPVFADRRPDERQLDMATTELMNRIYEMGEHC